jgi:hypothetical protein
VEIKCQLDATDEFLLQILLLAQHVSDTIMPITRSSRLLYKWFLPVVFGAWISSCRYSVELRIVCPVCGLLQQPANRTHNLKVISVPHYSTLEMYESGGNNTPCVVIFSVRWR